MKKGLFSLVFALTCLNIVTMFYFQPILISQNSQLQEVAASAQAIVDELPAANDIDSLAETFLPIEGASDAIISINENLIDTSTEDFTNELLDIYTISLTCDKTIQQKVSAYQEAVRRQRVANERATRGSLGRLSIPSVGVDVAVFGGMSQGIVDAADSAACFGFHGGTIIGDHNYQGFGRIRSMRVGSYAYFEDGNTKTRYVCTGKISNGVNTKSDLVNASGGCVCGGAPGGYVLYTCNDWSGRSITIVFLQPG